MTGSTPNCSGTIQFINPGAILTLTGNFLDPATDSGGFWSTFGTALTAAWAQTLADCLNLVYGGVAGWSASNPLGWRAPTANELMTVYDFSLASAPFGNANLVWPAGNMWSSTILKTATTKAFSLAVNTNLSTYGPFAVTAQTSTSGQRPVRSLIYNG